MSEPVLSPSQIRLREHDIEWTVSRLFTQPVWVWKVMLLHVPPEVWIALRPHVALVTERVQGPLVGPPSEQLGPMELHQPAVTAVTQPVPHPVSSR